MGNVADLGNRSGLMSDEVFDDRGMVRAVCIIVSFQIGILLHRLSRVYAYYYCLDKNPPTSNKSEAFWEMTSVFIQIIVPSYQQNPVLLK